jgi:hypothetical protein
LLRIGWPAWPGAGAEQLVDGDVQCDDEGNLSLPKRGWGELHVERAEPYAGKEWTDSGRNRDQRPLKQRARGEVRLVPCPPR